MPGRATFALNGGCGFVNAVRRALHQTSSYAPAAVTFRANTSSRTDEYISHRLGLLPFSVRNEAAADATYDLTISASGPCVVRAADIIPPDDSAPQPTFPHIELLELQTGERLDCTLHLRRGNGCTHARYNAVAAVGMSVPQNDDTIHLSFETVNGSSPADRLLEALSILEERVARALGELGAQPATAPTTMC